MNLDANFRTAPALLPGQTLPHADKFVLVLTSGGPEHHPAIELVPYGPRRGPLPATRRSLRLLTRTCSAIGTAGAR
eukprot:12298076-Alexandrium_andersonii.AAC.1